MRQGKEAESLPPPPPLPENVIPKHVGEAPTAKLDEPLRFPITRRGLGTKGTVISLLSNHFRVDLSPIDDYFFHYSVSFFYEDGSPVDTKGISRKVIDKVQETYSSVLNSKTFAYDGEKSLFTIGALPSNQMEFVIYLDTGSSNRSKSHSNIGDDSSYDEGDLKRIKKSNASKTYKVQISFATKIPIQSLKAGLHGKGSENVQEAVRVLDIILRQHAARQGCLIVRQSFFPNDPHNCVEIGDGILGCRGFHSSFRATQSGLSLNLDGSTTTIIQPGPVIDFLLQNQRVRNPNMLSWDKAKRTLKNLRIFVKPSNQEYRITGLSEAPCKDQMFTLKRKMAPDGSGSESIDISVAEYFLKYRQIKLEYSGNYPCINVGKPKKPVFIPIELCHLLPLQRYTKALTVLQRSQLVEKSRQKPQEKMKILTDVMEMSRYNEDLMLKSCGLNICNQFTRVEGRILTAPKLKIGRGEEIEPRNGRWNFSHKLFLNPAEISDWAVLFFSARCNVHGFVKEFIKVAKMKGNSIKDPEIVLEEDYNMKNAPPHIRVEKMLDKLKHYFPQKAPSFLLCLLPERKNSDIYGPLKRKTLIDYGIVCQCISPGKVNEQYITNLLLKINAKLGGFNSLLTIENARTMPLFSKEPTIIFGMDVCHGSPGRSDVPSIAAVVSSRKWPLISQYRASIRSQSPKVEMIEALCKQSGKNDSGIIRELLQDFYQSSGQIKPTQIIIFRDGVSESQFSQVLNVELPKIIEACKLLDEQWSPKFTLVVVQKNHHTKFFVKNSTDNVPAGTVVDTGVCHPTYYDFYMCAQAGMIGTTRPTHYHVLLDEIGFSSDELQQLVHSLSYIYQRSTTAISQVAPVRYAHLAASLFSKAMKYEETDTSSHGSFDSSGQVSVPEAPKLHDKVRGSMFFC